MFVVVVCVVEVVDYVVVDYVDDWFGYFVVDVFECVDVFLYDYVVYCEVGFWFGYLCVFGFCYVVDFGCVVYGYYVMVGGVCVGFYDDVWFFVDFVFVIFVCDFF